MTQRDKHIITAAKWGVPYTTIAEHYGVTPSRISQICTKHEVRRKQRPRRIARPPATVR